jgi:glycine oxidase
VTASYDVVVAGGGPVGAACARELSLTGRRVLVLEPGGEMGQGWRAAAGMLAPQIEARDEDPLLELGLAGRELYGSLAGALRETTGIDIGLWREGIAWVAASEAEAGELRARCAWQRQHGHLSDWLDADEVKARWPWLGPTAGALWAAREGAVEPEKLVAALLADAQRLGAVVLQDTVTGLDQRGDRVVGVIGTSSRYAAADVILAAGAWSGLVEGLPRPLAVAPVRGQMAALPWPEGAPRGIVYGHGCYLLARGDEAIVGSTMEYVGFRPEVTSAGLARIFAGVTALCPSLTTAAVKRTWAGLRPVSPDGLPIIGPEPRLPGLWYATGHGRNGILLAGITGVVVRQLIAGEPTVEDIDAFAPSRFWSW